MGGIEGRDPYEDYCTINEELGQYQYRLLERPQIVVANKMDEENAEENLKAFKEKVGEDTIVNENCLIDQKYILAQSGKKNYYLIIVK